MTIILNGQPHSLKEPCTILTLIASLNLAGKPIIIEYNLEPLNKDNWSQTLLKSGDKLEIITLAAGG